LTDYGRKITIENLLHHTGGIREYTSLMLVGGFNTRFEDFFDNAYVYRLLCRQKSLNFLPGEAHQYSNGGYIMLATIVERVSGRSLRQFADSVLFKPLAMGYTFFSDDHDEVIPNRVQCYRPVKDGYAGFVKNFETYGDGGIFTTVEDLAKWDAAFYEDRLGIPHFAEKMTRTTTLNDGHPVNYAMGLNVGVHKGLRTVEHGGFMLAYDSEVLRFPDQRFTVIVLSNSYNTWSTTLAYRIADIYLSKQFTQEKPLNAEKGLKTNDDPKAAKTMNPAKAVIFHIRDGRQAPGDSERFAGHYWNIHENYYVLINASHDSLYYDNTFGYKEALVPLANDSFKFAGNDMKIAFSGPSVSGSTTSGSIVTGSAGPGSSPVSDLSMHLVDEASSTPVQEFVRFDATPPTLTEVGQYAGVYYSEELQATYSFTIADSSLRLTINLNPAIQLFPAGNNIVWNSRNMVWIGFAEIIFQRDSNGKVTGFNIGDGRLRGITFKKTN
jgi:hypothetical protein